MRKNRKKSRNSLPGIKERKSIIVDYLNSLGPDLSDLGSKHLYNINDLERVITSNFYQEKNLLSYHECLSMFEVLFSDKLKNKKQPVELELASA